MRNLDSLRKEKEEIIQRINQAMKDGDDQAFGEAFAEFQTNLQENVLAEARGLVESVDAGILNARGIHQLTSGEREYFTQLIDAMKSSNPQQAISDMEVVMPKTTIDAVFEDLVQAHPLLEVINFQNTSGLIEYIVNTNSTELATWDVLTSEIVKELTGGFKKLNMALDKLSAFIPVAKAMLDLGPEWLERYVRTLLSEAIAFGLENGIVAGTGKNQPIGMIRQVGEGVTVTDGVYPEKAAVAITKLDPETYGRLVSGMTKAPNGKTRPVTEVILVVNPVDYLTKVMPATTIRGADGRYVNDVFPFPTRVVQSAEVAVGRAVMGLPKRYFMGVGTAKSGKIEYSDEYRFLEDERVYLTKLYGHGEPLDNNAFVYLDISGLKPAIQRVELVETGAALTGGAVARSARLSRLAVGSLALTPAFDPDTADYTALTTNNTNAITVATESQTATVEIKVGETVVANGTAATWATGENVVDIQVTDGDKTATYTVTVTKSA